jgi:hypothetical protein
MSKNGLKRHYDKLTPGERFRLDVLAMAWGDKQESERLVSSCPKFSYTMTDNAFSGRWLGALDITLRSYLWVAGYLDRLKTLEAIREILPLQADYARERLRDAYLEGHRAGARQAWQGDGPAAALWPLEGIDEEKVDELADLGASIMPEILDGLERREVENALTLWRGFAAFCGDFLDLDALKVLTVVLEPGVPRIEGLEATAERLDLEPDAEQVEEIREGLAGAWRWAEGQDRG